MGSLLLSPGMKVRIHSPLDGVVWLEHSDPAVSRPGSPRTPAHEAALALASLLVLGESDHHLGETARECNWRTANNRRQRDERGPLRGEKHHELRPEL
jgi:hypothetical protein